MLTGLNAVLVAGLRSSYRTFFMTLLNSHFICIINRMPPFPRSSLIEEFDKQVKGLDDTNDSDTQKKPDKEKQSIVGFQLLNSDVKIASYRRSVSVNNSNLLIFSHLFCR